MAYKAKLNFLFVTIKFKTIFYVYIQKNLISINCFMLLEVIAILALVSIYLAHNLFLLN